MHPKNVKNLEKLNKEQIKTIVDKLAPILASPEDQEFFKGVLFITFESFTSSAAAAAFAHKLLTAPR